MSQNVLLIDAFNRIQEIVHETLNGLSDDDLTIRVSDEANTIAWLIWHLTRGQDAQIADIKNKPEIWSDGWYDLFDLPFHKSATGYGHSAHEVGQVKASTTNLLGYYDATHDATIEYLEELKEKDFDRVIDKSWDPPVTVGTRIISILSDDLQHAGQASFVKGIVAGHYR